MLLQRVAYSKKIDEAVVAAYEPHVCSPNVHFNFKAPKSVKYLKDSHRAAILGQRSMTPGMLRPMLDFRETNESQHLSAQLNAVNVKTKSATCKHTGSRSRSSLRLMVRNLRYLLSFQPLLHVFESLVPSSKIAITSSSCSTQRPTPSKPLPSLQHQIAVYSDLSALL